MSILWGDHEGTLEACPRCGGTLVTDGCIESRAGRTAERRLVTDGGQPTDDESSAGESTDGQATDGRSGDEAGPGGQSTDGQSTGGQRADGGQAATDAAGGQGTATGGEFDVGDLVDGVPLKGGATIGAFALVIPYVLLTLGSYVPLQREEFSISAELYATIVGFGPGERFVDLFIDGTHITALGNVDPGDYPSVAQELDAVVDTLRTQPEALLLPLYVFAPLVCFLGGRHLAKNTPAATRQFPTPAWRSRCRSAPSRSRCSSVSRSGSRPPPVPSWSADCSSRCFSVPWGAHRLRLPGVQLGCEQGLRLGGRPPRLVRAVILVPLPSLGAFGFDLPERVLFGMMAYVASVNFGIGGAQGFVISC